MAALARSSVPDPPLARVGRCQMLVRDGAIAFVAIPKYTDSYVLTSDPERFPPQAFWDSFDQILPEKESSRQSEAGDPLEQAQLRLLGLWKERPYVSRTVDSWPFSEVVLSASLPADSLLGFGLVSAGDTARAARRTRRSAAGRIRNSPVPASAGTRERALDGPVRSGFRHSFARHCVGLGSFKLPVSSERCRRWRRQ